MKIAWFCIPAYGHTNPTLGVVRELTGAGHEVTYFSFERFREEIEAAGAAFVPCGGAREARAFLEATARESKTGGKTI